MKTARFLLLLLALSVQITAFSQQKKISIVQNNITIKQALDAIKAQSGISNWFDANDLDAKHLISVNIKEKSVEEALQIILKGMNVRFEIKDNHVIISKSEQKSSTNSEGNNSLPLKGKVTDEKGLPIIGATIQIK